MSTTHKESTKTKGVSVEMTIQEQFKPLTIEFQKLDALLKDPEPGTFTWCEFMLERLKAIRREVDKLLPPEQIECEVCGWAEMPTVEEMQKR